MAATPPISGILASAMYGWETTYATAATASIPFGHAVKISNWTRRNNVIDASELNSAEQITKMPTAFEGSCTIEFIPGNAFWLKAICGTTATDAGTAPYTHTYINSGVKEISKTCPSFTLEISMDLATDYRTKLLGCMVKRCSIKAASKEAVRVSLDIAYASESIDTTLSTAPPLDTHAEPFVGSMATLEMPQATTIADCTDWEITMEKDIEILTPLGSRVGTQAPNKPLKYSAKATVAFESFSAVQQLFMGAAGGPSTIPAATTLRFFLTNGGATTSLRSLDLKFTGVQIDEYSLPTSADDIIKEDITLKMKNWTFAVYTDNTATAV